LPRSRWTMTTQQKEQGPVGSRIWQQTAQWVRSEPCWSMLELPAVGDRHFTDLVFHGVNLSAVPLAMEHAAQHKRRLLHNWKLAPQRRPNTTDCRSGTCNSHPGSAGSGVCGLAAGQPPAWLRCFGAEAEPFPDPASSRASC
jgi:hypothetical protein